MESAKKEENLCKELEKSEGAGYSGYIAILLYLFKQPAFRIVSNVEVDEKKLYYQLVELSKKVELQDEKLIGAYLIEVKRVLEALPV